MTALQLNAEMLRNMSIIVEDEKLLKKFFTLYTNLYYLCRH